MNPATTSPNPGDPWEIAKARFLNDLDDNEKTIFENATLENIYYSTSNINRSDADNSKTRFVVRKLGPLVSAIEGYGKALDTFAQIAPLYLAPIWGAIRVVLVVARAHGKFFEKVSEVLERIGDVLPRFRDYERIFDQTKHPQLTQALSNAYLDIILVCHDFRKSLQQQKSSSFRRLLKPASTNPEFDSAIERFRKHRDNVRDVVSHIHLLESAEQRNAELVLLAEDRKRKLLSKLSKLDCAQRHRKLKNARHDGTGLWLSSHPDYSEWQTSTSKSSVLCCYGIPGSGKSVLVSSIIDLLDINKSMIYYYCDYADKRTLEPANIWGTLARQILEKKDTIPDTLTSQIDEAEHDGERLSDQLIALQILKYALELLPEPIYIIFDGIDEASEPSQKLICHGFKEILTNACIKLLITGRDEMGSLFRPDPGIPFSKIPVSQSAIAVDIENFVRAATRRLIADGSLVLQDPTLEELIVQRLVEGTQGMFLWVEFQLHDLCEPESDRGIKLVLENLPRSLSETYDRLLAKIEGTERRDMISRMFKWIVCARQPLLVDQLREGIAFTLADIEWDSERIPTQFGRLVRACGNLVIVDGETQIVQLAHHTVQQYLLSQESSPFHFTMKQANTMAGETCVAYLNFTNFDSQITPYKENTNTDLVALERFASSRNLISPDNPGQRIVQVWNVLRGPGRGPTNFDMASHLRQARSKTVELSKFELLSYVVVHWLWHTIAFDLKTSSGDTQVDQLDRRDRLFRDLIMTKDLLFKFRPWERFDEDCSEDIEERRMACQQLIGWALVNNHTFLVRIVLCAQDPSLSNIFWNLWRLSYQKDLSDEMDLAESLPCLLGNEELNTPNSPWTSDPNWLYERLCYACQMGHYDVLKACLNIGSRKSRIPESLPNRFLLIAAASGQLQTVKLLFELDSIYHSPAITAPVMFLGRQFNLLESALLFGQTRVAKYLMSFGFQVKIFTLLDSYFHVLEGSIQHNALRIVESLFLIPDCINKFMSDSYPTWEELVSDQRMSKILVREIQERNQSVVEILLRNGVSPNVPNDNGSIPLIEAITSGNEAAVETLIRYGCELGNTNQGLPLTLAVSCGHLKIAELLVEGGAEVFGGMFADESTAVLAQPFSSKGSLGFFLSPTPLYIAAYFGRLEIAEMLVRNGAAVDLPSIQNWTRIILNEEGSPVTRRQEYLYQEQGQHRNPQSIVSSSWESPMEAAVRRGHWDIVHLLHDSYSIITSVVTSPVPGVSQNFPDFMMQSDALSRICLRKYESVESVIEKTILTTIAKSLIGDGSTYHPHLEVLVAAGARSNELWVNGQSLFLRALNDEKSRLQSIILVTHPNADYLRLRTLVEALEPSPIHSKALRELLLLEAEMMTASGAERIAWLKAAIETGLSGRDGTSRAAVLQVGLDLAKIYASKTDSESKYFRMQHLRRISVLLIIASDLKPLPTEIQQALRTLHSDNGGSFRDLLSNMGILKPKVTMYFPGDVYSDLLHEIRFGNESKVKQICIDGGGALINNTKSPNGASPLIYAARQGTSIRMMMKLISLGAEVEAFDDLDESALHKVIRNDGPNVLKILEYFLYSHGFPVSESHLQKVLDFCVRLDRKEIWIYISKRNLEMEWAKKPRANELRYLEPFRRLQRPAPSAPPVQDGVLNSSWATKRAAFLRRSQSIFPGFQVLKKVIP